MNIFYKLDGKRVVPSDRVEWGNWVHDADRRVAYDKVGDYVVSTVFFGMDMSFGRGPPLVFETMAFDDSGEELDCRRYASWEEAEAGHLLIMAKLANQLARGALP